MLKSESPAAGATAAPGPGDCEPVETIAGSPAAGLVILCDHASNEIPARYADLGLTPADLARHIAWDIGAAEVARGLAARLGAPAVLARFSRLLIDANRGADDPTLVMRLSDGRIIPGNARIDDAEVARRRRLYWKPYRDAVGTTIEAMMAEGTVPAVVSIHSFTPVFKGIPRPWQAGILWDSDARLAAPLIAGLRAEGFTVGDNEPYDGALDGDTLDGEVTRRGLAGCLVEIRQDLVADAQQTAAWADRLARLLAPILKSATLHCCTFHPSRTGRHRGGEPPVAEERADSGAE